MSEPAKDDHVPARGGRALRELFAADASVLFVGDPSVTIAEVGYDSRLVGPGALFFAVPGEHHDGHDFLGAAAAVGASAAVVSREMPLDGLKALAVVPDVRRAMGPVAHRFFEDPTESITLVGVTGTNGKTTTTHILHHVFATDGPAGLVGTVEYRIGSRTVEAVHTTPESVDLARVFADMRDEGVGAAAMEVSSHALAQGRHSGCVFDVVAFSNLSQDHLDYHRTMEEYFAAKKTLFVDAAPGCIRVVNADDAFGGRLVEEGLSDVTYGTSPKATLRVGSEAADVDGTTLTLSGMGFECTAVRIPLVGGHNVANAACAAAVCRALGIGVDEIAARLSDAPQVPGRLERIDEGQPFAVFVDYAHTPDGLAKVIPAVRDITQGRVLTVFGCGGDRDRAKRPLMGEIAARESDLVYVTSDNPRLEEPRAIVDEILVGVRRVRDDGVMVDEDRRAAIAAALDAARAGDSVIIAGKGHETGQKIGDRLIDFDDRVVAREMLTAATGADDDYAGVSA